MPKTFIENIFYGLYADEPDNEEIMYYYNTLHEDIRLFADPKYKDKVEGHFYGIICGLCRAEEMQGFKRGLSHAFKLAAECTATPDITTDQAKADHESLYRKDMQFAATLRAAEDIPITSPKATASKEVEPPAAGIKEPPCERDYMDEALLQTMRIGEAQAILEEALDYEPFDSERDRRQVSKLLSAALDIQRQAIPEAQRLIMKAIEAA